MVLFTYFSVFSGFRIVPADGGRFQSKKLRNKVKGREEKFNFFKSKSIFCLNNNNCYFFSS
jgi:hypothetical protein